MISMTEVLVEQTNQWFNFGGTEYQNQEITFFNSSPAPVRIRSYNSERIIGVSYEISPDLTSITRSLDYGAADFLADIGGMFGFTMTVGTAFTMLLTYDGAQYFVTSSLLKTSEK